MRCDTCFPPAEHEAYMRDVEDAHRQELEQMARLETRKLECIKAGHRQTMFVNMDARQRFGCEYEEVNCQ